MLKVAKFFGIVIIIGSAFVGGYALAAAKPAEKAPCDDLFAVPPMEYKGKPLEECRRMYGKRLQMCLYRPATGSTCTMLIDQVGQPNWLKSDFNCETGAQIETTEL